MYPLLFQLGPIKLYSYGLLCAIGLLVGQAVSARLATGTKITRPLLDQFVFTGLIVALFGCHLLQCFVQYHQLFERPWSIFFIWEDRAFIGGPIAVALYAIYFSRKHKISYWTISDVMLPGLVIGHAFGRVGCFLAGCCHGRPTSSGLGVKFHSVLVEQALRGVPVHPTQLYEALALVVLFTGLLFLSKRKVFEGQVGLSYFIAYPTIRFILEFFRGDSDRGYLLQDVLSTSQFVSALMASFALFFFIRQYRRPSPIVIDLPVSVPVKLRPRKAQAKSSEKSARAA